MENNNWETPKVNKLPHVTTPKQNIALVSSQGMYVSKRTRSGLLAE